ncbi:tetratricopeptide repeat protein [candidate division KSB1 bacterium]|nr:tetratricopeptide repeat protein [candidate division KSB1 bacterium]
MFNMHQRLFTYLCIFFLSLNGILVPCHGRSPFLDFTPNARSLALGRSGIVLHDNATALYWNPAALGYLNAHQALVSLHEPYTLNYSALAHFSPKYGAFSAAMTRVPFMNNPMDSYMAGWGKRWGTLAMGVSIGLNLWQDDDWAVMGLGALWRPGFARAVDKNLAWIADRLTLGLAIQNIPLGAPQYDHQARLGFRYEMWPEHLSIYYAHHFQRGLDSEHVGLQLDILPSLSVMAGTQNGNADLWAVGSQLNLGALKVGLVYDAKSKRVAATTQFRLGRDPKTVAEYHYERARSHLRNRETRQALREAKLALSYDQSDETVIEWVRRLQGLLSQENIRIDSLLVVANEFADKNWYMSAAANYLKVLRLDPENKKAAQAIKDIRPLVDVHSEKWSQLGIKYFEQGDLGQAREIFESILLVSPEQPDADAYLQKIDRILQDEAQDYYYRGLGYYSQRNLDRARQEFVKALEKVPRFQEAQEYIERIAKEQRANRKVLSDLMIEARRFEENQAWAAALNRYQQMLRINPEHSLASERIQIMRQKIKNWADKEIIRIKSLMDDRLYDQALALSNQILKVDPNHEDALQLKRQLDSTVSNASEKLLVRVKDHMEGGEWNLAMTVLDSIKGLDSNSRQVQDLKDQILEAMDVEELYQQARRDYYRGSFSQCLNKTEQIIERNPNHLNALELQSLCQARLAEQVDEYFNRGIQLYSNENYRAAIDEWEKALAINPLHKGSLEYINRANERLQALDSLQ